ncbi:MAG: hypothetical protein WC565_08555 [Parcubacteria group bacterium]|jgi:S-adenosylhomocysteine hydrolase
MHEEQGTSSGETESENMARETNAADIIDSYTLQHLAAYAVRRGWDEETTDAILSLISDEPSLVLDHGWDEIERMVKPRETVAAGSVGSAFNLDGSRRVIC